MRTCILELATILLYLGQGFIFAWYVRKFVKPRFSRHRFGKYYIVPVYVIMRELIQNLWHMDAGSTWITMIKQAVILVLLYLCIYAFYRSYLQMRIYLSVSFMAISEICTMIVLEVMQLAQPVFMRYSNVVGKGQIDAKQAFAVMDRLNIAMQYVIAVIFILVLWLLLKLVTRNFRMRNLKIENEELLYLTSPALIGLVLAGIFRGTFYSIEDGVPSLIYEKYPFLYVMIPLALIVILAGMVLAILSYQKIARKNDEAMGAALLGEQMAALEEHLKEIERAQDENRRLRHDLKNIAAVALAQPKESDGADDWQEYLADVSAHLSENTPEFQTGNGVMDSLLAMKSHEAKEEMPDIEFLADTFMLPESLKVRIYDLSIIMGNALDNAIEACIKVESGEKRFIEISSEKKKGMLFIYIRNSFDGKLNMSIGEPFPGSTKADPERHGIGMENMRRIADRYYGGVTFEGKEDVFLLKVMLQDREPVA